MVAVCEQQFGLHDVGCDVLGDGDVSSNEVAPRFVAPGAGVAAAERV